MFRRLVASTAVALIFAIGPNASVAARPHQSVICEAVLQTGETVILNIVVGSGQRNFGQAVRHCLVFWNGTVLGFEE